MFQGWWNTIALERPVIYHYWKNLKQNEKYFLWSILASLPTVQRRNHPNRVTKYQDYGSELKMSGVKYPVDIKDIGKFEY